MIFGQYHFKFVFFMGLDPTGARQGVYPFTVGHFFKWCLSRATSGPLGPLVIPPFEKRGVYWFGLGVSVCRYVGMSVCRYVGMSVAFRVRAISLKRIEILGWDFGNVMWVRRRRVMKKKRDSRSLRYGVTALELKFVSGRYLRNGMSHLYETLYKC